MDLTGSATPDSYFEEVWARSDDPWEHGSRWYEERKYELTIASLPRKSYTRSFEPGCGAGFLTERLARRSRNHLAMERHPRGVRATTARCDGMNGVTVIQGQVPGDWPTGTFDLIVLSEVLYYLGDESLELVLERTLSSLAPGGDLIAVHYLPTVAEHVSTGDDVHRRLVGAASWQQLLHVDAPEFIIDVVRR